MIYFKTKPVYKKILSTKHHVKYRLINDSTITNLQQSLLCLDLNHITGFENNCTTAMESLAHTVDNIHTSVVLLLAHAVDNIHTSVVLLLAHAVDNIHTSVVLLLAHAVDNIHTSVVLSNLKHYQTRT